MKRTDTASRVIAASPATIYKAFLDPQALVAWLPPHGMTATVQAFEPRVGGAFRMTLTYDEPYAGPGKTSEDSDVVQGRFVELVPDERVVQLVDFQSDDPAFAGPMKMTWRLARVSGGTCVTILAEDVPAGIRQEDHDAGLRSTLANLAAFTERT